MLPILTVVRRVQCDPKYGRLPESAMAQDLIVIGWETFNRDQYMRCITPAAKLACDRGELDPDWKVPMTYKGQSTIFLPCEVTAVGVWDLKANCIQ